MSAPASPQVPRTVWRDDLIAALTGGLLILGLFLDGWNHLNLQNGRAGEFLTPWHGLLYAGFNACAIWAITRNARVRALMQRKGGRGKAAAATARPSAPQASHIALLGLGLAGIGVVGDALMRAASARPDSGAVAPPFDFLLFTGAGLIFAVALRAAAVQVPARARRVALPSLLVAAGAIAAAVFTLGGSTAQRTLDDAVAQAPARSQVTASPAPRQVHHSRAAAAHHARHHLRVHRAVAAAPAHVVIDRPRAAHAIASPHHGTSHAHARSVSAPAHVRVVHRVARPAPAPVRHRVAARPKPAPARPHRRFRPEAIPNEPASQGQTTVVTTTVASSPTAAPTPAASKPAATPVSVATPTTTPTQSPTTPSQPKHGGQGPG